MTGRPQLSARAPRRKDAPIALDGLLVVDFTRVVAGPACTQTLADFGAEVIKIENPDGGDDTRSYEHADLAGERKRDIALDLTKPAAREVARELIARADVVVENFSSGVMKKYGLDYASVEPTNPRLVYCSISAYGRQGPFASRPGFDPITQAESGFMSLNGFPDGPPVRTGPPSVDMMTGMSACNAILLALFARERLGRGQHVEVALIDIAVAMTQFYGMAYLMNGVNPSRQGNSPNGSPSVGVYNASDAPFYIACANDRLYRRLVVKVLGRPDLTRSARKLGCEDEDGQYPRRLSSHGRRGFQLAGNASAPAPQPNPPPGGGFRPQYRIAAQSKPDAGGRSRSRAFARPAH